MSSIIKKKPMYPMFTTAAAMMSSTCRRNSGNCDGDTSDDDLDLRVPLSSLGPKNGAMRKKSRKIGKCRDTSSKRPRRREKGRLSSDRGVVGNDEATERHLVLMTRRVSTETEHSRQNTPSMKCSLEGQDCEDVKDRSENETNVANLDAHDESADHCMSVIRQRSVICSLFHRATTGKPLRKPLLKPQWNSRTSLTCHAHSSHVGTMDIMAMAWDPTGVLLAAATSHNTICLWEWDVWVAQDLQNAAADALPVPPTWTFATPRTVSSMQWNTRDELAVAFRGISLVRVYRVAKIIDNANDRSGWIDCSPPSNTMVARSHTPSAVCFSSTQAHLLWISYSSTGRLILWNVDRAAVEWTWQESMGITCIRTLPDSSVLLGATDGSVTWIDSWQPGGGRKKAFSADRTSYRPTILEHVRPPRNVGMVQNIQGHRLECQWVTSNGWVMHIRLSPRSLCYRSTERLPVAISIRHSPAPVKLLNADGRPLATEAENKYSVPPRPVVSNSIDGMLCWQDVPTVTRTLPHHDKFVGDSGVHITRSRKKAIRVLDSRRPAFSERIKLDKTPTALAVHPSEEWIVVASQETNALMVWNTRGRQ